MSLSLRIASACVFVLMLATAAFAPPPRRPVKQPAGKHPEIREAIKARPAAAFGLLKAADEDGLTEADKLALAREAVEAVAVAAEAGDAVAALADVRGARASAADFPEDVRAALDGVCQAAERRALGEALGAVRAMSGKGRWAEASKEAGKRLAQLNDARLDANRDTETAGFRVRLGEAREALEKTQALAARAAAAAAFQTALASDKRAESLGAIDRDALPAKLARQLDCLRGMAELKELTSGKWEKAPDIAQVKAVVARFERGLGDRDDLGNRLLQDLAVKALLDGFPETAVKLLPKGSPDHAAKLLADLSALALGEGKVTTLPADGPPTGLLPLIPESARKTWKAPAKEKGDPSSLERAEKVALSVKAVADRDAAAESAATEAKAADAVKTLAALHDRVMAPELAERKKFSAAEAELDRRLTPAERVRMRAMLAEKKTVREIAEQLKMQPVADPENEYLAEVARRLGGPLDDKQTAQAKRLRNQGRSSAEAAEIIKR